MLVSVRFQAPLFIQTIVKICRILRNPQNLQFSCAELREYPKNLAFSCQELSGVESFGKTLTLDAEFLNIWPVDH